MYKSYLSTAKIGKKHEESTQKQLICTEGISNSVFLPTPAALIIVNLAMVFRLFNNAYDRPPSADQYSILAASNRDRARNHFPNTFYGIAS